MGVAVFAPCLLVVVDGCFSLPADAARRLKLLPKRFVVEGKGVEKEDGALCTWRSSRGVGKRQKNNGGIENTEGIERRGRWCWASLGWHDRRGTSVKQAGINSTTSGCWFHNKCIHRQFPSRAVNELAVAARTDPAVKVGRLVSAQSTDHLLCRVHQNSQYELMSCEVGLSWIVDRSPVID